MKQKLAILLCVLAALLLCACQQSSMLAQLDEYVDGVVEKLGELPSAPPTPEEPETTAEAPVAEASPSPTATATASPSPSPTPKPKSTQRPKATLCPTPSPTVTPTASPTATPSPTPAPGPTPTPKPSEAPIPQSVPFRVEPESTPTPTPAPEPEPEPENEPEPEPESAPRNVISAAGEAAGYEIAAFAEQYVGYPYKWAGSDPDTGFDCSGFVSYVYGQFGYTLDRTAAAMASNGTHVDEQDIAVGDVICFYNQGSSIGHVGIYVGDGMYIHSQDSATGVVVSLLSARTCRIEIRRIVE